MNERISIDDIDDLEGNKISVKTKNSKIINTSSVNTTFKLDISNDISNDEF